MSNNYPDYLNMPSILDLQMPQILPGKNILETHAESNYASEFHKRLTKWIEDYDASLDSEHEVGIRLVTFGQSVTFRLESMGYWNPSLLCFRGVLDDGTTVELIQHVSQLSVLLMTLPRLDSSIPKKPIGFAFRQSEQEAE